MFFGRTDAKAEALALWPPHGKSWLIGKDSDAGRDWGQEEKGTTEDEMAGWLHRVDEHEFEWTLGLGDGQGGLACCSSWGRKEPDMTERLNWTDVKISVLKTDTHSLSTHTSQRKPMGGPNKRQPSADQDSPLAINIPVFRTMKNEWLLFRSPSLWYSQNSSQNCGGLILIFGKTNTVM